MMTGIVDIAGFCISICVIYHVFAVYVDYSLALQLPQELSQRHLAHASVG
jgi:hypothetical protein